ncbi:MAG TPA: antitoxin [Thermoanaerobaculia bacterium]|nr:antitoxin [Thermoanaerobaculia bacterium]
MRTTVDIADPVLADVREEQEREGKSLGQVVSELLAEGIAQRRAGGVRRELRWVARDLRARIDIRDKETLWAVLDGEERDRS